MKKAFIALILLVAFVGCEDMDKECETLQVFPVKAYETELT